MTPRLLSQPRMENGLAISEWQIGDEQGIRMVLISGKLDRDVSIETADLFGESNLPTVIVSHLQTGAYTLTVSDFAENGFDLLYHERYSPEPGLPANDFAVYADGVSVEMGTKDDSSGYRGLQLARRWAFDPLSE